MFFRLFTCVAVAFLSVVAQAQHPALRQEIDKILRETDGKIGVAILNIEDRDTMSFRGRERFPMQSVFKFPIGLAVLNEVDQGRLSLRDKIYIAQADLLKTFSPMRDKYPEGNVYMSIEELLYYMVTLSDNNACDILMKKIGGPKKIMRYLNHIGIRKMDIKFNEQEMARAWDVQYKNWSEPVEMIKLLELLYQKKALSDTSTALIWKLMVETVPGAARIKGNLPQGTVIAHRTGTSNTNPAGITAAINDVGIMVLPNGKHIALAVFVSDSRNTSSTSEAVIARIARATWDEFVK